MSKQVFLSYSTYDVLRTIEIRDMLETNGISCWIGNRDILPGANYAEEITLAIEQCTVFVLILSENAQKSQYVISELECARAKKKPIIPYIIKEFDVSESLVFHIRNYQGIQEKENKDEAEEKLVLGIKHWCNTAVNCKESKEEKQIHNETVKKKHWLSRNIRRILVVCISMLLFLSDLFLLLLQLHSLTLDFNSQNICKTLMFAGCGIVFGVVFFTNFFALLKKIIE